MSDLDALVFANEAFYQAFTDRDIDAMEALWAPTESVTCIHPGWGALSGREEVLESWAAIISNPDSPPIRSLAPHAVMHGDTGYVICFEEIAGQFLIATNVFIRDGRLWKMVHHQAGPTSVAPDTSEDDTEAPMH